jgi:hypothetical protein
MGIVDWTQVAQDKWMEESNYGDAYPSWTVEPQTKKKKFS